MIYMKQEGEISEFDGVDLLIFPLKKEELNLLNKDSKEFSDYINLEYDGEDVTTEIMKKVYGIQKTALICDEENWVFHTMWMICSLSQRKIVGSIDFKNVPNDNSEVEIGYGINEKYWNQGYATLAVELLCKFAKENGIRKVVAITDKTNIASQKVLDKNFFDKTKEDDLLFYFEKDLR